MLPFGINELPHFQGGRSVGVLLPQGQPLGKTLFKFGHGPGAQGIGTDFVYHGLFLHGSSLWDRGHTIARSSEQYAEAKKRKSMMQEKRRESLGITRHILWFRRTDIR
jgi:hypothetical protein